MKRIATVRGAFTLIELVIVIVIMGIVSMIGTDIIAHMYEGYLRSRSVNELQQKTELALDIIAKRLQNRIKDAVFTRIYSDPSSILPLSSTDTNASYNMLEWIGYDYEGMLGENNGTYSVPGWSGFVDLGDSATDKTQIVTKGSHLDAARHTIYALSYGDVNISDSSGDLPAVVFKCWSSIDPADYGLDPSTTDHNATLVVRQKAGSQNILQFTENTNDKEICEQYYLAWSAYAIVPEGSDPNDFNLTLLYDYRPWLGEAYDTTGAKAPKRSLLAEHVSTFRFTEVGNTIRIKLCIHDANQSGEGFGFCKERAVF